MPLLHLVAIDWQKTLPPLGVIGAALWLALFCGDPTSERALFSALLVIYMAHQTEEHLWPGGFRQFTNANVFHSGNDDWPVDTGGVALVNIGYVWLPVLLAAIWPVTLRWVGLAWVGLTLINAVIHVVTTIRLREYNPEPRIPTCRPKSAATRDGLCVTRSRVRRTPDGKRRSDAATPSIC